MTTETQTKTWIVTATKMGNYIVIRIPKEVRKQLAIEPRQKLAMKIHNNEIIIKKIQA